MLIEVWSDVVCPWCYIGKRNLEAALINFAGKDKVGIKHRVSKVASDVGLKFRLAETETGNTLDAHRLLLWAQSEGDAQPLLAAIYRAYFEDARSLFDHENLLLIATESGHSEEAVKSLLASDDFADAVEQDQTVAASLGAFAQVLVKASA